MCVCVCMSLMYVCIYFNTELRSGKMLIFLKRQKTSSKWILVLLAYNRPILSNYQLYQHIDIRVAYIRVHMCVCLCVCLYVIVFKYMICVCVYTHSHIEVRECDARETRELYAYHFIIPNAVVYYVSHSI